MWMGTWSSGEMNRDDASERSGIQNILYSTCELYTSENLRQTRRTKKPWGRGSQPVRLLISVSCRALKRRYRIALSTPSSSAQIVEPRQVNMVVARFGTWSSGGVGSANKSSLYPVGLGDVRITMT